MDAGHMGKAGPAFANEDEAREIFGLIMRFYNDIVGRLQRPRSYGPLIDEDSDGTFLWEFWAQGFGKALSLRPAVWSKFDARPDDDPAALAFSRLASLAVIARATDGDPDLHDEMDEGLMRDAPDMIVPCVLALHADRIANHGAAPAGKAGRNDPCPCGSGKRVQEMLPASPKTSAPLAALTVYRGACADIHALPRDRSQIGD